MNEQQQGLRENFDPHDPDTGSSYSEDVVRDVTDFRPRRGSSEAHEDRIKSLEDRVKALEIRLAVLEAKQPIVQFALCNPHIQPYNPYYPSST